MVCCVYVGQTYMFSGGQEGSSALLDRTGLLFDGRDKAGVCVPELSDGNVAVVWGVLWKCI